ncbi:xanthine dehydrogenase accessory protein XdhC [Burkholderia vietnamiensis]|uniref:xanthine dehydrogenase accessory protein XdhC n=1 Tax=Burkholderia vietnamiensis TaxID=60552 RepID=UPI000755154D|nr:xanthine dehydrogenase accessory protein XdhC [Burkholderia vietnamiensis]KVF32567.1 twitching motility protein PilT [Burkholderia vietnamiensis]KVF41992.1 twitching motility protein PilT [Burkholderia vietnamiensis]HDR9239039.1 xanthine dehydrogenase accessory protein XdhC [Burkholderia vietnamiensis]
MNGRARSPHGAAQAPAVQCDDGACGSAPSQLPPFARGTGQRNRATAAPPPMHIVLFGAGHVGHALVTLLGALPCVVQWVDTRDELFPDECPPNVQPEPTDTPEAVVDAAPAGAYFLVMTHNHALDFALAAQIMRRHDFAYFGMIGSRTKRVKFERRLVARGVDAVRLAEMVCPIGVAGIVDKAPGAIAVAVCAELLQVRSGLAVADTKAGASTLERDAASCLR